MNEKIDVLYIINDKYLDIMKSSLYSLLENSELKNLNIHVITENLSKKDFFDIEKIVSLFDINDVFFYNMPDIDTLGLPNWRGNQIANARLFLTEIMKNKLFDINKLLYLDADTIIKSSLTDLYNYDNYSIMAVKDHATISYRKKLSEDIKHYYNSGVLLININDWLKKDYMKKISDFIQFNNKKLFLPDQDVLNCALYDEFSELPLKYNITPYEYIFNSFQEKMFYCKKTDISIEEINEAKKDPKIIHTIGLFDIKPWHENNVNPFNDDYLKYLLKVNPNFDKKKLSKIKQIITYNPQLFYYFVSIKRHIPEDIYNKSIQTFKVLSKRTNKN